MYDKTTENEFLKDEELPDRNSLRNEIAGRLFHLRSEQKLTQEGIAFEADVDRRSISRYERGDTEIPGTVLAVYAKIFNKSVDFLVFGDKSEVILKKQLMDFIDKN